MAPCLCWCGCVVWPLPGCYQAWAGSWGIPWEVPVASEARRQGAASEVSAAADAPSCLEGDALCLKLPAEIAMAHGGRPSRTRDTVTNDAAMQLQVPGNAAARLCGNEAKAVVSTVAVEREDVPAGSAATGMGNVFYNSMRSSCHRRPPPLWFLQCKTRCWMARAPTPVGCVFVSAILGRGLG